MEAGLYYVGVIELYGFLLSKSSTLSPRSSKSCRSSHMGKGSSLPPECSGHNTPLVFSFSLAVAGRAC